jgi:hypothetical protein
MENLQIYLNVIERLKRVRKNESYIYFGDWEIKRALNEAVNLEMISEDMKKEIKYNSDARDMLIEIIDRINHSEKLIKKLLEWKSSSLYDIFKRYTETELFYNSMSEIINLMQDVKFSHIESNVKKSVKRNMASVIDRENYTHGEESGLFEFD